MATSDSPETIVAVREYRDSPERRYGVEAGFQIETSEQVITLAIDDESSCCESWGYFLTEDDTEKFIGAELRGVSIVDTNRSKRKFVRGWDSDYVEGDVHLDEGDTLFVDIETERGVLQFVAYNAHNGYYGHTARVSSTQLTEERTL